MIINAQATHLLIRYQEISLKGKNRPEFERRLIDSIQKTLIHFPQHVAAKITSESGRYIVALKDFNPLEIQKIIDRLCCIGGITAVAPCCFTDLNPEHIKQQAASWALQDFKSQPFETFAVRSKRTNKNFPHRSTDFDAEVGSAIFLAIDQPLKVKLKKSDWQLHVEIRNKVTFIYSHQQKGPGGLPLDPTQRVVCLLSGGIDSPVAAYEILRRGCAPVLVHFHSKPFTSEASIDKAKKLARQIRHYSSFPLELWLVPLLDIQKAVRDNCNPRYRTLHYRKFMLHLAQELAYQRQALALVTGEAIGQVASQTLANIQAIQNRIQLPIFRPLISLDKEQIIEKARRINTYEISIEPHDDTCVLFAPDKPATKASLNHIQNEFDELPVYSLIFSALDQAEKIIV